MLIKNSRLKRSLVLQSGVRVYTFFLSTLGAKSQTHTGCSLLVIDFVMKLPLVTIRYNSCVCNPHAHYLVIHKRRQTENVKLLYASPAVHDDNKTRMKNLGLACRKVCFFFRKSTKIRCHLLSSSRSSKR